MDNGRYVKISLPPGPYVCRSTDKTVATFDLAANETHYMKIEIVTGFMKGHGVIQEVPVRQGEVEIRALKPADADNLRPGVKAVP